MTWPDDVPAGALAVTVLRPTGAFAEMLRRTGSELLVLPVSNVTATPSPETLTAVTSVKFVPRIVAFRLVPAVPCEGDIELMEGGTRD